MHKCHGHVFLVELLLPGHIIPWLFSTAYFPCSANNSERRLWCYASPSINFLTSSPLRSPCANPWPSEPYPQPKVALGLTMARDSGDGSSIRPISAYDTVHQLSSNLSRLSHVGSSLWESTRSRLTHQHSPYKMQRYNVLKRKNTKGGHLGLRRRALTSPLPEKGSGDAPWNFQQQTVQQTSSELCTKLPYEVRSLILELVVAGERNVVHVYKKSKRMGHWRCRRQVDGQPCTWIDPCSKSLPFKAMTVDENGVLISGDRTMQRYFDRSKILSTKKDSDIGSLSLLCTCRQT
jgi:hypothetical protein